MRAPPLTWTPFVPDELTNLDIETCELNDDDLGALAKKAFVLLTVVGPYGQHGEHASVLSPSKSSL